MARRRNSYLPFTDRVEPVANSACHAAVVMNDSIKDRFIDAASLFLYFGAADPDGFGVCEKLLDRFCDRNDIGADNPG